MGCPRIEPTEKEIEQCRSCKNQYAKCNTCVPGSRNYEKMTPEEQRIWDGPFPSEGQQTLDEIIEEANK